MPELTRWCRALDLSEDMVSAVRATLYAPRAWADRPGVGIGPYLRERRLASGTTLSRAAVELGLPLATLGHYESGRVEVPAEVLAALVERFAVGVVERAALCDGPSAFLEWCDSLVERRPEAEAAIFRAAWAVSPTEIHDRGPAFVRLRTGLLRARLRGPAWSELDARVTSSHAFWLAVGERRMEAAVALSGLRPPSESPAPHEAAAIVARRYLGQARDEEILAYAEATVDPAVAAWLFAEAALDALERRRGGEARETMARAQIRVETSGDWAEVWCRKRDAVRLALRLRDWPAAEAGLSAMAALEPSGLGDDHWYLRQRNILAARQRANEATARPAGP